MPQAISLMPQQTVFVKNTFLFGFWGMLFLGQPVVKDKTKKLKLEEKETLVVEERGPIEDSTKKK